MNMQRLNITARQKAGAGSIRITEAIGAGSAAYVREQVDAFLNAGVVETNVYVNSNRGDYMEALEIVQDLKRLDNVGVTVGTVAAGAATFITCSFPTKGNAGTQIILQRPKMGIYGNVIEIAQELSVLENLTNSYYGAVASKMGTTPQAAALLLATGTVVMGAAEANQKKLLDSLGEPPPPERVP